MFSVKKKKKKKKKKGAAWKIVVAVCLVYCGNFGSSYGATLAFNFENDIASFLRDDAMKKKKKVSLGIGSGKRC